MYATDVQAGAWGGGEGLVFLLPFSALYTTVHTVAGCLQNPLVAHSLLVFFFFKNLIN